MIKHQKVSWRIILPLAILKFALPYIAIHPYFELQRDEYLYYQQGLHPAVGYMENPPMLSWFGTISSWLGGAEWTIKFWPALFGVFTLVITCKLVARWGGGKWAQGIAALSLILSAFARVHVLYQPNILDIFSWVCSIYLLVRFQQTNKLFYWYSFAGTAVFGFYSKYTMLFFLAAICISWLLSNQRKLFFSRHTWIAVGIGIFLSVPNILWQYHHNWPLVHHMEELRDTQLAHLSAANFIKEQFLFLLPFVPVWVAGLFWLLKHPEWRWIFTSFFIVLFLLMLGSGKGYYALGIYPPIVAAGTVCWQKITLARRWIRYAFPVLIITLSFPMAPILLPFTQPDKLEMIYKKLGLEKTGLLRWEDLHDHPLPQDFADMTGWKELARKAEYTFNGMPDSIRNNSIIYCRHYGQAGSLKYYGLDENFRRRVISDNGSFLLWIDSNLNFHHLLYVGRRIPDADDEVFNHFESMRVIDSVTNPLSRQFGDKIILYSNADSSAAKLAREGIAKMKKQFQR